MPNLQVFKRILTFQERDDVVEFAVVAVTFPNGQPDQIVFVVRDCVICKVDVNNFFNWPAKVAEVFDVLFALKQSAFTT